MKKLEKIIISLIILLVSYTINISAAFGVGLTIAFLLPAILLFFDKDASKYSLILLPLVMISICQANRDMSNLIIYSLVLYSMRVAIMDDEWNSKYVWILCFSLCVTIAFVNMDYAILPLMSFMVTLPIPLINFNKIEILRNKRTVIGILSVIIFVISLFYITTDIHKHEKRTAYFMHGNWANANVSYVINDLRNESIYSYSEFVDILQADTITKVSEIWNYDEVWIVTPTNSFTSDEIDNIENWVNKGGQLFLVSDHTDLYGHGRCINQIARRFQCEVDYAVAFNYENTEFFQNTFLQNVCIKSGNTVKSINLFPLVADYLWVEPAYYANPNYFGPVMPSGNDDFGLRTIVGTKSYGKGNLTILCDSTIFANFCLYQPLIPQFINSLRHSHPYGRLLCITPFLLIILLILIIVGDEIFYASSSVIAFSLLSYVINNRNLNWGENPQIWSGNPAYVYEGCPNSNISTAYSLSCLSGRKPMWINDVDTSIDDVIWVDTIPPVNSSWRWIKIEDDHNEYNWSKDSSAFSSLYLSLNMPKIYAYPESNFNCLPVKNVFNDRVMNNWWYNDGVSTSRLHRIKSWISWLRKENFCMDMSLDYSPSDFSNELHKCTLIRKEKDPISLLLPKPQKTSGEVYLGNGLSANIYEHDGVLSLIGYSQMQENSECDDLWIIDYHE